MKLIDRHTETVTTDTFQIERDDPSYPHNKEKFIYIEYLNDKGRVIDCNLRETSGEEIDDANLLDEIQKFVDKLPNFHPTH